jgi:hypothetical protein
MANLTIEDRKEIVRLARRYLAAKTLNDKMRLSDEIGKKVEAAKAK